VARGRFEGPARAFVRWILTDGAAFIDAVGYVALPDAQRRAQLDAVDGTPP